jgi:hypothetical protein
MRWILTLVLMISPVLLKATVTVGSMDCPQQFEGRVISISDEEQSGSLFNLERVELENLRTLKGEVKNKVFIEIIRGGPFELDAGKSYSVQMRSGRLCWVEEI